MYNIGYFDETTKRFVQVSDVKPLPTTGSGGGGGASGVIVDGSTDNNATSQTGQLVNSRLMGFDGSTWDRVRVNSAGHIFAAISSPTGAVATDDGTNDNEPSSQIGLLINNRNYVYNESSFERMRGNTQGTLLPSLARTATTNSSNQTNHNAKGVVLMLNITNAAGGSDTLTLALRHIDPVSGENLNHVAAINVPAGTTSGLFRLIAYPGSTSNVSNPVFNANVGVVLPRTWQASVIHSGVDSWTYSLSYQLIV